MELASSSEVNIFEMSLEQTLRLVPQAAYHAIQVRAFLVNAKVFLDLTGLLEFSSTFFQKAHISFIHVASAGVRFKHERIPVLGNVPECVFLLLQIPRILLGHVLGQRVFIIAGLCSVIILLKDGLLRHVFLH